MFQTLHKKKSIIFAFQINLLRNDIPTKSYGHGTHTIVNVYSLFKGNGQI